MGTKTPLMAQIRNAAGKAVVVLGLVLPAVPAAAQTALTPDGFTTQVAAAINAGRPNVPVRIVAPLTLEGQTPTGQSVQMNLDRIYALCRADQPRCPETVAAYVGQAGTMLRQSAAGPTQAGLRVVVRPESYVRNLPGMVGGTVPTSSRFLPPGLLALVYLDAPASMRLLTSSDLRAMRISDDQAFTTALQNTARALQPLDQVVKPVPPGEIGGFRGTAYESSRLLFVADWSRIAAQFGSRLLVAVPSSEEVLYANGSGAGALSRISAAAHARFAQAERPTSAAVYEWRPDGWIVVAQ